ncbi:MAG: hypothetical protein II875_02035 [Clostridia bacterium]|nr:hypothetical protein [Clostridia bacterium]
MVVLQKYTLLEFTIFNDMTERKAGSFQVKPEINFTVLPRQENKPLVGDLTITVGSMDDNSPLYIKARMRGQFIPVAQGPGDALTDIKEFHKQAFPVLFDVLRAYISTATLAGGLTPFSLPPIDPNRINFEKKQP